MRQGESLAQVICPFRFLLRLLCDAVQCYGCAPRRLFHLEQEKGRGPLLGRAFLAYSGLSRLPLAPGVRLDLEGPECP